MSLVEEIHAARTRLRPWVRTTPLEPSPALGPGVFLKCENLQETGSFKLRGAMNRLLALSEEERARGIVAASTGNHGQAVALGARRLECAATVFVPRGADPSKVASIGRYGAQVVEAGADPVDAESAARAHVAVTGAVYVSPYNDRAVVAGQGTVAVELSEQMDGVDAVFVTLGGGGLLSGVGAVVRAWQPNARIYACSPENSAVMHHSLRAGRILALESLPTLSDGSAGGVEAGSITFDLVRQVVDESLLVSEAEIADALRFVIGTHHMLVEGAAATAVAGYRKVARDLAGERVAIVLCGANIGLHTLRDVLAGAR